MATLEASAEGFLRDGSDSLSAAATFCATAEAAENLLHVTRKVVLTRERTTNIVVSKDVAGTDNHEAARPLVMRADQYSTAQRDAKGKTSFSSHSKVAAPSDWNDSKVSFRDRYTKQCALIELGHAIIDHYVRLAERLKRGSINWGLCCSGHCQLVSDIPPALIPMKLNFAI